MQILGISLLATVSEIEYLEHECKQKDVRIVWHSRPTVDELANSWLKPLLYDMNLVETQASPHHAATLALVSTLLVAGDSQ